MRRFSFNLVKVSVFVLTATYLSAITQGANAVAAFQSNGLVANWNGSAFASGTNNWTDPVSGNTLVSSGITTTNTSSQSNTVTTNVVGRGSAYFGNTVTTNASKNYTMNNSTLGTFETESVFMWINASNSLNAGLPVFFRSQPAVGVGGNGEAMGIGLNGNLFYESYDVNNYLIYSSSSNGMTNSLTSNISDGKWHYVGIVRYPSASGESFDAYVDGVKQATVNRNNFTTQVFPALSFNYLFVGGGSAAYDAYQGSVAQLSLWNTALSATDVLNNYNATASLFFSPSSVTGMSNSNQSVQVGSALVPATPTVTAPVNGTSAYPSNYSISPALPAGVTIDTSTGIISGTPTVVSASQVYTITAANNMGSKTTTFNLAVTAVPVFISFTSPPSKLAFRQTATFTTSTSSDGTVTFYANNKKLFGCVNVPVVSFTATCNWVTNMRGTVYVTAVLTNPDKTASGVTPITYFHIYPRQAARSL